MENLFLAWAVTATIAACWYAYQVTRLKEKAIWGVKMMLKLANNEARVIREGRSVTFHYEDDRESNTIKVEVK